MKRKFAVAAALVVGAGAASGGAAIAAGGDDDATETPITGSALDNATAAALEHTGGGRVTGTEVGDEESYYEVEVTLDGGRQVDVQLDKSFNVVSSEGDREESGRELSFASCPHGWQSAEPAATRSLPKPKTSFRSPKSSDFQEFHSAGGGSRTHTGSRHEDFKSSASTVPPPRPWVTGFRGLRPRPGSAPAHSRGVDRRSSRTPRR